MSASPSYHPSSPPFATERPKRQRPEENPTAAQRQYEALLDLAKSPELETSSHEAAMRLLTESAARGLDVGRASVWFYGDEKASILCDDLFEADKAAHSGGLALNAPDFPRYFAALAADRTIAAEDAATHPATSEFKDVYLAPLGIGSMLEAPIRRGGQVIGVLCNEHVGPPRSFSREDQVFAASVADLVARTLDAHDRRAAEERLRLANEELARHKERLEAEVEERTRALAARDAENQELIRRLRTAVDQLSSPVLELWDDVLALPVIGVVDSERAATMVERLLDEVARGGARYVLVDLTGVDVVDTGTADRILKLAQAVKLLGADCMLTGVQPLVAQTLVDLGAEFGGIATLRNLKQGLLHALQQQAGRKRARASSSAPHLAR